MLKNNLLLNNKKNQYNKKMNNLIKLILQTSFIQKSKRNLLIKSKRFKRKTNLKRIFLTINRNKKKQRRNQQKNNQKRRAVRNSNSNNSKIRKGSKKCKKLSNQKALSLLNLWINNLNKLF